MRKFIDWIVIVLFLSFSSYAENFIPNAKLVGAGSLHYYIWLVYDAKLYSDNKDISFSRPFFLTLHYKLELHGEKIAERSAEEIRQLGFKDETTLAEWHEQMRHIFPDVKNGSTLTGVYRPNQPTVFYSDKQLIGSIEDPDFGKWFFGIWLSEETSAPALRQQLLGK